MNLILNSIETVREIKTQYGLKPRDEIKIVLEDANGAPYSLSAQGEQLLTGMAKVALVDAFDSDDLLVRDLEGFKLKAAMAELIDVKAEIAKLEKELAHLQSEIKRSEKMLGNPGFVSKAPQAKIDAEREKLEKNKTLFEQTTNSLADMKARKA